MSDTKLLGIKITNNVLNIHSIDLKDFEVVDIRELYELPRLPQAVCRHEYWPLSELESHFPKIDQSKKYLFFCQAGVRTLSLIEKLHEYGADNTFSLDGGVFAFRHLMR